MDESVSKWGIGSGISFSLLLGFSGNIYWNFELGTGPGSGTETPSGTLPMILVH